MKRNLLFPDISSYKGVKHSAVHPIQLCSYNNNHWLSQEHPHHLPRHVHRKVMIMTVKSADAKNSDDADNSVIDNDYDDDSDAYDSYFIDDVRDAHHADDADYILMMLMIPIFSDYQYSPVNFLGVNICVLGSLIYTKVNLFCFKQILILFIICYFTTSSQAPSYASESETTTD